PAPGDHSPPRRSSELPREMGRRSENETLERVAELGEIERLHVERVGEDEVVPLDAVAAVHDVRRVELEQPAVERSEAHVVRIRGDRKSHTSELQSREN